MCFSSINKNKNLPKPILANWFKTVNQYSDAEQ